MSVRPIFIVALFSVLVIALFLSGCVTPLDKDAREYEVLERVLESCQAFQYDPYIHDACVIQRCNRNGCWN